MVPGALKERPFNKVSLKQLLKSLLFAKVYHPKAICIFLKGFNQARYSKDGGTEEHLEEFDREVQTTLRRKVTANIGPNRMMPQSTLFMLICGINTPFLSDSVAWMKDMWLLQHDLGFMLKIWRCVVAFSRFYILPVTLGALMFQITLQVTIKMAFPFMKRCKICRLPAAMLAGLVQFVLILLTSWAQDTGRESLSLVLLQEIFDE